MSGKSPNSLGSNLRNFKPRTPGGAAGALLGAAALSVVAGVLVTAAITPAVAVAGATASSAISIFENLPSHINPGQLAQPSHLYAKNAAGEEIQIASFWSQNRQMVAYDQISDHAKNAAVSEEDPRFWSHGGIDVIAASRAVLQNVTGSGFSGASTITMQYVRNVLIQEAEMIPDEKERKAAYKEATSTKLERKLKEMRLALQVEKSHSKEDILLGYLNIANFGGQVYGIESAAHAYYSTTAAELTIPQAASLIAIVNNPGALRLDIAENHEANKQRRDKIIDSMLREGKITQQEHDEAIATPIEVQLTVAPNGCEAAEASGYGNFCDYVARYIQNDPKFGKNAEERWFKFQTGGYKIMTTLNTDLQARAVEVMRQNAPAHIDGIDYGAAAVSVENSTGHVKAMTQNRYFSNDADLLTNPEYTSINFNTDYEYGGSLGFQYGSTMKAFTLAEWIRSGHSVNDRVNISARPVNFNTITGSCLPDKVYGYGTWTFQNHARYNGQNTVLYAMDQSVNGGFVSMTQQMDLCKIYSLAEDMGMHRASDQTDEGASNFGTRKLNVVPSGVYNGNDEIAPITIAAAYTGFAESGKVCSPVPIEWIQDAKGENIEFTGSSCKQAIPENVANTVGYALEHYITNGLARAGRSNDGIPRMGKTGTTDNAKDAWMVGGSSEITTAVWQGNVVGKQNLLTWGLHDRSLSMWTQIQNTADGIYGGSKFPEADLRAVQRQQTVPDTTGKTVAEAKAILEAAGFTTTEGEAEDSTIAKGSVVRTDPLGGTSAPAGSVITIIPSTGNPPEGEKDTVPSGLTGVTASQAAAVLRDAGYSQVFMQCEGSGTPAAGMTVVSSSPASGEEALTSEQITLIVRCS